MLPTNKTDEQIINDGMQKDPNAPSEELKKALIDLRDKCLKEDNTVRQGRLSEYRRLELLWNNFSNIFWDDVARDYRIPTASDLESVGYEDAPRSINIYKPHGESIIAALSSVLPGVIYYPDDADNPDDCETSRTYDTASKLISRHIKAKLQFMKALYILFNQGTVFAYNYLQESPKFGTIRKTKIAFTDTQKVKELCPTCGYEEDAEDGMPPQANCPLCGGQLEQIPYLDSIPQVVGFDETPKSRVKVDLFGPLNVKVSYFAKDQDSIGYLALSFEQHYAMMKELVKDDPELYVRIRPDNANDQSYAKWARLDPEYLGALPTDVGTVNCIWFRPWRFQELENVELIKECQTLYPNGCYLLTWNDLFIEAYNENLDDHWSISYSPMSPYIHGTPLGENLATIQDIRDDILDLEIQTIERGIGETLVDSKVLDFDKYGNTPAMPGQVTPAKPAPGKSLSDAVFQFKPAQLSAEVPAFVQRLDQDGQFVVGDFPSVFGGTAVGGSKTASEYSQSRSVALQRLGNVYAITAFMWADLLSKCSTEYLNYIKNSGQDEKLVERDGTNFINSWIKQASLTGKVGHVEPENADSLPETWSQIKDVLLGLITLKDPQIASVLFHPKNLEMLKKAMGLRDLYVPGEDDRNKQLDEFIQLTNSEPIGDLPSVMPDEQVDNDLVHIEVLTARLVSPEGQFMKINNPAGWQNNLLHLQMHQMNLAKKQAAMQPAQDSANSGGKDTESTNGNEVTG